MPRRIQNITDEPHQEHTLLFEESEIELTLRFLPVVQLWYISVAYKGRRVQGVELSVGVLHMESANLPFDFAVRDQSGRGLDPIRRDDFSLNRCALYLLDPSDMEELRGVPVPL